MKRTKEFNWNWFGGWCGIFVGLVVVILMVCVVLVLMLFLFLEIGWWIMTLLIVPALAFALTVLGLDPDV